MNWNTDRDLTIVTMVGKCSFIVLKALNGFKCSWAEVCHLLRLSEYAKIYYDPCFITLTSVLCFEYLSLENPFQTSTDH